MNNIYASITSMISDAQDNTGIKYLANDDFLPYIETGKVFYYYSRNPEQRAQGMYTLQMVSSIDLQGVKE